MMVICCRDCSIARCLQVQYPALSLQDSGRASLISAGYYAPKCLLEHRSYHYNMCFMSRCSLPRIKGFCAELLERIFKLQVALVYFSEITRPQRGPKQPKNRSTSIPIVYSRSGLLGINTLPLLWIFLLLFKIRNIAASNCFARNTLQTFIVSSPPHFLYSYLGRSLVLTS